MKDCQLHPFERNRYFYGKLLTVRDFETEQRYYMEKLRLINRLIHGIGIAYGLEVSEPQIESNGRINVKLTRGVALDCCGNEIVVSRDARITTYGNYKDGANYIYISYAECEKEPVPSLANSSACEESCCNSRIEESFEILVSSEPSQNVHEPVGEDGNCYPGDKQVRPYLTGQDRKVLLAVINITGNEASIDQNRTKELREIVYHNPILYYLYTCLKKSLESHLNDMDNPHGTTANQVGALVSIDGVSNPGGNVDLAGSNSITISPNNNTKTITIGESHSSKTDNPHKTQHGQTNPDPVNPVSNDTVRDKHVSNADGLRWNRALTGVQVNGGGVLENPGGAVNLAGSNSITISPNNNTKTITIGESHSSKTDNPHKTQHGQTNPDPVNPVSNDTVRDKHVSNADGLRWNRALTGVQVNGETVLDNPGGAVNLVAGKNVELVPDEKKKAVTISAVGGSSAPTARTGRVTIMTDEKGYGSVTVDSGFDHNSFFVYLGVVNKGFVEYGNSLHFAGQLLNTVVRVYNDGTILPILGPTAPPIGHFSIIIDVPKLSDRSVPICWFAVPAMTHLSPTIVPTIKPTINPTIVPTINPTINPTIVPTINPTINPTIVPTINPTINPTIVPTINPTINPTIVPTINPTINPTIVPTINPTITPTIKPTISPTILPTIRPTIQPLTEVNGIIDIYASRLTQNGISSIKELADAEPVKVSEILGVSEVKAMSFIDEARRLLGQ